MESLKKAIEDKVYRAGDLFPAEIGLAAQYGVSRGTMRKAIKVLVDDGILTRIPGKGTFIHSEDAKAGAPGGTPTRRVAGRGAARGVRRGVPGAAFAEGARGDRQGGPAGIERSGLLQRQLRPERKAVAVTVGQGSPGVLPASCT